MGAAQATCFAMAVSVVLGRAGFTPDYVDVTAHVTVMPQDEGFRITKSHLVCEAKVPGTDHAGSRGLAAHQRELDRLLEWAESDGLDGGILRVAELRTNLVLHVWRQKYAPARDMFALMRDSMDGGTPRSEASSPRPAAPEANAPPGPKQNGEAAMDATGCIAPKRRTRA